MNVFDVCSCCNKVGIGVDSVEYVMGEINDRWWHRGMVFWIALGRAMVNQCINIEYWTRLEYNEPITFDRTDNKTWYEYRD